MLYILSIILHSIKANILEIYHLPFYYPLSHTLTYGHPLFGISAFFKLFDAAGLTLTQGYNLYLIAGLIAGAWGCYLLAREISGHPFFSLIFSTFYILSSHNRVHFIWLNYHSAFWMPFVFFFFVKYFKTKRKIFAVGAASASFYLFFSEIYYGAHLWAFLLPVFLVAALGVKACTFREFRWIVITMFVAALLILVVFRPFLVQIEKENLKREAGAVYLLLPQNVVSGNSLVSLLLKKPHGGTHFFPGNLMAIALLFFFSSRHESKKNRIAMLLTGILLIIGFLLFWNLVYLQLLFFILIATLIFLAIRGWAKMDKMEKLILVTSFSFFLLMLDFNMLPLLKKFHPYVSLFHLLPGLSGLRVVDRVVLPMEIPFLIVMAAVGFRNHFGALLSSASTAVSRLPFPANETAKRRLVFAGKTLIGLLIFSLLYVENVTPRYIMRPLPRKEKIYEKIPFRENRVILEIPWDYGLVKYFQNGKYMFNWQFHQNPIMNGCGSYVPVRFIDEVNQILFENQPPFPSDSTLKWLIENHSIQYVLFHWDLIRDSYGNHRERIAEMKKRIESLIGYGKIVYSHQAHLLLRVQEFVPVREIVRTYSRSHLKQNIIHVELTEPYRGRLAVRLNGKNVQTGMIRRADIRCDFRKGDLSFDGNRIELHFQSDILLKDIRLEKPPQ